MVEDGVENFVVPPADEDGERFEIDATARGLDLFKGFSQRGETARGVPDGEMFWMTGTGDDGLYGCQGTLVGGQVGEGVIG